MHRLLDSHHVGMVRFFLLLTQGPTVNLSTSSGGLRNKRDLSKAGSLSLSLFLLRTQDVFSAQLFF